MNACLYCRGYETEKRNPHRCANCGARMGPGSIVVAGQIYPVSTGGSSIGGGTPLSNQIYHNQMAGMQKDRLFVDSDLLRGILPGLGRYS